MSEKNNPKKRKHKAAFPHIDQFSRPVKTLPDQPRRNTKAMTRSDTSASSSNKSIFHAVWCTARSSFNFILNRFSFLLDRAADPDFSPPKRLKRNDSQDADAEQQPAGPKSPQEPLTQPASLQASRPQNRLRTRDRNAERHSWKLATRYLRQADSYSNTGMVDELLPPRIPNRTRAQHERQRTRNIPEERRKNTKETMSRETGLSNSRPSTSRAKPQISTIRNDSVLGRGALRDLPTAQMEKGRNVHDKPSDRSSTRAAEQASGSHNAKSHVNAESSDSKPVNLPSAFQINLRSRSYMNLPKSNDRSTTVETFRRSMEDNLLSAEQPEIIEEKDTGQDDSSHSKIKNQNRPVTNNHRSSYDLTKSTVPFLAKAGRDIIPNNEEEKENLEMEFRLQRLISGYSSRSASQRHPPKDINILDELLARRTEDLELQVSDERLKKRDEIALRKRIESEERLRKEKEEKEERERREKEAREKAEREKREQEEREAAAKASARSKLIQPVSQKFSDIIDTAVARGSGNFQLIVRPSLTGYDLSTLLGYRYDLPANDSGWLNDTIIDVWLQYLVDNWERHAGFNKSKHIIRRKYQITAPAYTFGSMWYQCYANDMKSCKGRVEKFHLQGTDMFKTNAIFIPICSGSHWTLLVIRPKLRIIEHLDSLCHAAEPMNSDNRYTNVARAWLSMELGELYKESEWTTLRGRSPCQRNGKDCGAFVCVNALAIARDLEPKEQYSQSDMDDAREQIAGAILNEGFSGEFDWAD